MPNMEELSLGEEGKEREDEGPPQDPRRKSWRRLEMPKIKVRQL